MNDWRLTGQEEYLFNVELKKISQEEIKNNTNLQITFTSETRWVYLRVDSPFHLIYINRLFYRKMV